jgi:hypothetical protein
MNVEFQGHTYAVHLPKSPTRRANLAQLAGNNHLAACGACLGLCTTVLGDRPKVTWESCQYSAGAYGERVVDLLVAGGAEPADLVGPGTAILFELIRAMAPAPHGEVVDSQVGFTVQKGA